MELGTAVRIFVGAFIAAMAGWLAFKTRLGCSWVLRRMKKAYKQWFAEAVDEHIEPKLEAVKANTIAAAHAIEAKSEATAQSVKRDLETHTREEGVIVETKMREALEPLVERFDTAELEHARFVTETQQAHVYLREQILKVQQEVETVNGRSLANLADAAEGRRIEADVPEADRSAADQRYVVAETAREHENREDDR